MDYIKSLPCPLASVWVQLVRCPVRRSKRRKVRSGYLYPWLLPCKLSSGCLCPLTKSSCFFQGSLQYNFFSPYWMSSGDFCSPCFFKGMVTVSWLLTLGSGPHLSNWSLCKQQLKSSQFESAIYLLVRILNDLEDSFSIQNWKVLEMMKLLFQWGNALMTLK